MKLFSLPRILIASILILVAAIPAFAQTNCIYDNGPHACILGAAGDVFIYDLSGTGVITFSNADGSVVYGTYDLRAEMDATVGAPGPIAVPFGTFGPFTLNILVFQNGDVSYQVDYVSGDATISETPPTPHVPGAGADSTAPAATTSTGGTPVPASGMWNAVLDDYAVVCVTASDGGNAGFAEFVRGDLEAWVTGLLVAGDYILFPGTYSSTIEGNYLVFDGNSGLLQDRNNPAVYIGNVSEFSDPDFGYVYSVAATVNSATNISIAYIEDLTVVSGDVITSCDIVANFTSTLMG